MHAYMRSSGIVLVAGSLHFSAMSCPRRIIVNAFKLERMLARLHCNGQIGQCCMLSASDQQAALMQRTASCPNRLGGFAAKLAIANQAEHPCCIIVVSAACWQQMQHIVLHM